MITLVLADDHEMVRAGFRMILEQTGQFKVVGEAADGAQAYAAVSRERPDVLLLIVAQILGQPFLIPSETPAVWRASA